MKAAVLGCGRMGLRHIEALRGMDINITGAFDVSQEALRSVVKSGLVDETMCYSDLDDLFKKSSAELYIIATTAPSHVELALDCIERGKANFILLEKPLAPSLNECMELKEAASVSGTTVAVNHQMRFMPQYKKIKELMGTKEFGDLRSIKVSAGNFGLAMNGSHYVEMMRYLFDEYADQIIGSFNEDRVPNPRGENFSDSAGTIFIRTKKGRRFFLDASSDQGHGVTVTYQFSYGQVFVDELKGFMYVNRREVEDTPAPSTRYGQPAVVETLEIPSVDIITSTQDVIRSLIEKKNYPSLEDGMNAVATLVAAHASNEAKSNLISFDIQSLEQNRVFPWA